MQISIRKFEEKDISNKVRWINDPANNTYLHYGLPLEEEKTRVWFEINKDRTDRYDAVIEADEIPCGLIGLLNIDCKNNKAEYYVSMGEVSFKGQGVATEASRLLLDYAFISLNLKRVYLFTEADNVPAQKLFEKVGFVREGVIHNDLYSRGKYVDRIAYGICKEDFYSKRVEKYYFNTPIQSLGVIGEKNQLFIKRDDLIPFSFGGNKVRKAQLFFEEIDKGNYDCVVTYGSSSSNHCRIVANMAVSRGLKCYIISPEEASVPTFNSQMMEMFGAKITVCPVNEVYDTIENTLRYLKDSGMKPYFIAGGGHGNIGTQAYVDCYSEIKEYEAINHTYFDYIFHASGTGTTQAGLICGQLLNNDTRKIIGISIARKNPRGRDVIIESVRDYLDSVNSTAADAQIEETTVFIDEYIGDGYGKYVFSVENVIKQTLIRYGIPMDGTYVGKAFAGMLDYLEKNGIENKRILFIHTGGTPLVFDYLNSK